MADDLVVSGGGSIAVATSELLGQGRRLGRLGDELTSCIARLSTIDRTITLRKLRIADAPLSALIAERHLDDAVAAIRWAGRYAWLLESSLAASAIAYGSVERLAQQFAQSASAQFSYGLGLIFPGLALLLGPGAVTGVVAYSLLPESHRAGLAFWLREHTGLLTNPEVVQLVRLGVMSADDFGGGLLRVRPEIVGLLGDEGLGLLGLTSSAATLAAAAGGVGALAETPVRVDRVSTRTDARPSTTFEERVRRIPGGDAQIRIDRFHSAGRPDRFEVYLGGTKDLGLIAGTEPWDMTSNVNALSLGDAGSYRAAEQAMRLAGIEAESPVQFVGHSQGGLIAAALASSGDYNARGLFTVGGVVSQALVPEGVPWVAIEHTDDLIPALGGNRSGTDAVLVRREVFAGETVPQEVPLPAHEVTRYRQTAAMLDRSDDGRSGRVLDRLNSLAEGGVEVTTTRYFARRLPE